VEGIGRYVCTANNGREWMKRTRTMTRLIHGDVSKFYTFMLILIHHTLSQGDWKRVWRLTRLKVRHSMARERDDIFQTKDKHMSEHWVDKFE